MDFTADEPMEESSNAPCNEKAKQKELLRAIMQLDRKFARKLIIDEEVKPVDVEKENLLRFLYVAVQSRDPPLVRELLEQKPELNNVSGSEILWIVAEDGDTEIATMLVHAGVDLNYLRPFDREEKSLLHVLIASDSPKKHQLAILMMDYGAEVNAEDINGDTPLEYAVSKNSFELVEELIDRGAIVDEFVISEAILNPRAVELMRILVRGDFPEATTPSEKIATTLVYLSYCDLDESKILPSVEVLMDMGIIIEDEVVLFSAVLCGKYKMVEFFLNKGMGTHVLSVLLHLATSLEQCAVAELLIRRGADINYRIQCQEFGNTNQLPIHSACENGSLSNVKLLLRLGVDVNMTDSEGNTPFSVIENTELNDLYREMIKHFAMLTSRGLRVNQGDMQIIRGIAEFSIFYDECLGELESMKQLKVFNHISIHTMLVEDVKKLSWLTRNCSLVDNYKKAQLKELFPLYHAEVEWKFRNSDKRSKLLLSQEKAACEVLSECLPNLVVAKIIFYLYMDNVQSFHCSMNV